MLSKNTSGIIGIILIAVVFLAFLFFVGKRVVDANSGGSEVSVVTQ